ncbi:MAG: efflux RND transporter permease subunit [Spirochaetales bacterium]|nr:efflux RND transporter permease subunit [Spirochaetales bacterium]
MNISEYSVKHPVTVVVLFFLLLLVAAIMVPNLAVNLYPDSTPPVLSISVSHSGAGPEDIEENITKLIEDALAGVKGIDSISSTSSFGQSRIMLEFDWNTDLDEAKSDVESVLSRIGDSLPDEASSPTVIKLDMNASAILQLALQGSDDLDRMKTVAEDTVQPALESIGGVASTSISGGNTKIVSVSVSANRLSAFGLSISNVSSALNNQNILSGGGTLESGGTEYQILTKQKLESIGEIRRLILRTIASTDPRTGQVIETAVRLEDVAEVSMSNLDGNSIVSINGKPGLYINVYKESEGNSAQVARNVKKSINEINSALPEPLTLKVLSDTTTMISATLNQVYKAAIQGALLTMLILLIFLRNVKAMFIIGLSIPISILITLMFMAMFNLTLNMITLTGLVLALGMTVDGSIVILENIHAYRERGAKAATAAILGSQEMFRAIVASTATTLCVFIPMILFKNSLGMMGQLFGDLVFTVVISLVVSLAVSVIIVPALAGPLMQLSTRIQKPLKNSVLKKTDGRMLRILEKMETMYGNTLEYCLSHKALVLLLVLVLFIFSFSQFGKMGMNLFARSESDDTVDINVTLPPGTAIDETMRALTALEDAVKTKVNGYEDIILSAGTGRGFMGSNSSGNGRLQILLPAPEKQTDTPAVIKAKLADDLVSIPGAEIEFSAGRFMQSSSAVDIEMRSESQDRSWETAREIRNIILRKLPEVVDPVISLEAGGPQYQISINRDRASLLGVSPSEIASVIRTAVSGNTVTSMSGDSGNRDVVVSLQDSDMRNTGNIEALTVTNTAGTRIPLANVINVDKNRAPSTIEREERQRVIHVTGDLQKGLSATAMQSVVESTVRANLTPDNGVTIAYSGEVMEIRQFGGSFILIIIAAIVLVFGVMASQFESFIDPLIIFFSIPLVFIGVIWIYILTGEAFSLFSAVGAVALVGVVVNNGIVLVDYTNLLRSRGKNVHEACIEAAKNRLQPILMTTLTTILGMVPLAFFPAEGADSIQPIGKTIVGGLAVGSLMTLFVTPVMYSLVNGRKHKKKTKNPAFEIFTRRMHDTL